MSAYRVLCGRLGQRRSRDSAPASRFVVVSRPSRSIRCASGALDRRRGMMAADGRAATPGWRWHQPFHGRRDGPRPTPGRPRVRPIRRAMTGSEPRADAIGYPTNRLLAVIDDPAEAAAAMAELAGERDRDARPRHPARRRGRRPGGRHGRRVGLARPAAAGVRLHADGPARRLRRLRARAARRSGGRDGPRPRRRPEGGARTRSSSATAATSSTTTAASRPRSWTCGAVRSRTSRATSGADLGP